MKNGMSSPSYPRGEVSRVAAGDAATRSNQFGGDLRRAGHHHLDAVLHRPAGIEEQDVLGAGAHVDGQDAHFGLPVW